MALIGTTKEAAEKLLIGDRMRKIIPQGLKAGLILRDLRHG